jgi:hypothetical protein
MSVGGWFTLQPLNLNFQPQIDQLNNRVSALENTVNNIQQQLTGIDNYTK